jgi:WD40 repeat protein
MGVVYEARQVGLNRQVALKTILAGGHASVADLDRFRTEAEAIARLLHPNIVQVYETGAHAGLPYFSLEFCPSGSLDSKLDGTPWEPERAAALVEALARAIQHAHAHGVIHRDLKPANVLLAADGTPKVTDFGLAKRLDSTSARTQAGAILGTPSYMAPEQAGGQAVGPATDVYALGAILYELMTGRPPFRAATPLDTVLQVVSDDPVPPTRLNPKTPQDLETIALKCLTKDPAKRYATAAVMADDLRRFQAGEPILARPAGPIEKAVKWAKRRPAVAGLSAAVVFAMAGGFAAVLYELRKENEARTLAETQEWLANQRADELARQQGIANEARARAERQEALANQRADELARQQEHIRRELHQSDLLRADLLVQGKEFERGEELLWRTHFTRPDEDDRRTYWRLWDLYRQRPRRSATRMESVGFPRCLSPDGRRVASVVGPRLRVCDAVTGAVQADFALSASGHRYLAFSRDGSQLGSASMADGSVTVWDLDPAPAPRAVLRLTAPPQVERRLALVKPGDMDPPTSPEQMRLSVLTALFAKTSFCFLDGDRVLIVGADRAGVWHLDRTPALLTEFDLEPVAVTDNLRGDVARLPAAPAGDVIPVVRAGAVQLWELPHTTGVPVRRTLLDFTTANAVRRVPVPDGPTPPIRREVLAAVLSPDGKWLVTDSERRLRAWDLVSGRKSGEAPNAVGVIHSGIFPPAPDASIAITADGTIVRAVLRDEIGLWRLPGLEPVQTVPILQSGHMPSTGLSPDGLMTRLMEGQTVTVYDHPPAVALRPLVPPNALTRWTATHADLTSTGPVIALDNRLTGVIMWDAGRREQIPPPKNASSTPDWSVAIAPTGTTAASYRIGLGTPAITVYDLAVRRATGQFPLADPERGPIRGLEPLAIAADGRTLVVETSRGLLVADLAATKMVAIFPKPTSPGYTKWIVLTPDGRAALCPGVGGTKGLALLLADGKTLAGTTLSPEEKPIGFSPDGSVLATTAKRKVILRDATTLNQIGEIPATADELGAGAFAPDGWTIATGGPDGKLRLWDVRRREELVAIDLAAGPIRKVVFTPESRRVRFIAEKQVGEFDLSAYEPYVDGNLTWNLLRILPELDRAESERVLARLRESHPDACRAGTAALASKPTGK